ncbi:MAG: ArsR/SmtB family transcription factor [Candidatus Geothermarchaeales archaeon]
MSTLFEKDVTSRGVLTLTQGEARALADSLRAEIMELLSHRPMSVADIEEQLRRRGYKKATTTIRHHVDFLRREGLVELTKAVTVRGAVLKYYVANRRVLTEALPRELEDSLGEMAKRVTPQVKALVSFVLSEFGPEIRETAERLRPCPHCNTSHFVEYVIAQILNRALADSLEAEDIKKLVRLPET